MADDNYNQSGGNNTPVDQTSIDSDTTRIESFQLMDVQSRAASQGIAPIHRQNMAVSTSQVVNVRLVSNNGLEALASPILTAIAQLRRPLKHLDLIRLRQSMSLELNSFEVKARTAGIADNKILLTRYILCAVIDEFVLDTPWGANSNWSEHSMLNTFHQDSTGGQKFFIIVDKVLVDPVNYIDLLEIIYFCLQLGFLGKYRIIQNGMSQLMTIKNNVYRQICAQRGTPERSYAVAMEPLTPATAPSIKRVPYLKLMGILCAALFVVYVGLDVILQFKAADVKEGLRAVVVDNSVIDQAGIRQDK